ILHRDIKPSNVLLVEASAAQTSENNGAVPSKGRSIHTSRRPTVATIATVRRGRGQVGRSPECFDGGGAPCPPEASTLARNAIAFLSSARPKLTDFGLAKVLDGDGGETKSGMMIGTPGYMAPEQVDSTAGTLGPATDVYGLGLVLYEMLTGVPAFSGDSQA